MKIFLAILTLVAGYVVAQKAKMNEPLWWNPKMLEKLDNDWIKNNHIIGVAVPLENKTVAVGEKMVLHCEIGGTPTPIIQWTYNGRLLQADGYINMEEKLLNRGLEPTETGVLASSLHVGCPKSGVFKCVGYNGYDVIESTAEITVEGQPKPCHINTDIIDSAPIITTWTESRAENFGNTATLICRSDRPSVWSWTFEDRKITNQEGRYQIKKRGDLFIHNITFTDLGAYYCTASNEFGNSTAETYLHVTRSHS
ncbi:hypothetical protein CRE_05959 [Caenorhabditis remanei]|uniref:Uncharacterized protein n=1 Tax=Caenorhabditis remanei TaxID=31234 RepID=E3MZ96_CAERE|nr:hypothetical protein CRE_05959 [Caenorhabditis remanei]